MSAHARTLNSPRPLRPPTTSSTSLSKKIFWWPNFVHFKTFILNSLLRNASFWEKGKEPRKREEREERGENNTVNNGQYLKIVSALLERFSRMHQNACSVFSMTKHPPGYDRVVKNITYGTALNTQFLKGKLPILVIIVG